MHHLASPSYFEQQSQVHMCWCSSSSAARMVSSSLASSHLDFQKGEDQSGLRMPGRFSRMSASLVSSKYAVELEIQLCAWKEESFFGGAVTNLL